MSTLRKLQVEIEKTLKRVQEGLGDFDDTLSQLEESDNANQREKLESNLKTEIKKLQRFREQIKTWATSNEIKDKSSLTQARADIERRMERFKVLEKEAKTKAFSKEGLQAAAARQDPKERARYEMRDWLNTTVDQLNEQIDGFEAELEDLGPSGGGKKNKKPPPRIAHLEESIARHRQHITRLEQMLRLLDNEEISAEDVEGVKDLVDDYLERNQEDPDEFVTPDDIYYDIIDILDGLAEAVVAAPPSHIKASAKDKEIQREKEREEKERERQKAAAAAAKAQLAALGNTRLANEDDKKAGGAPPAVAGAALTTKPFGAAAAAVAAAVAPPSGPAPPPPPPPPGRPAKEPASPAIASLPGTSSSPGTPVRAQTVAAVAAPAPGPSPLTPAAAMPSQSAAVVGPGQASQEAFPALSAATANTTSTASVDVRSPGSGIPPVAAAPPKQQQRPVGPAAPPTAAAAPPAAAAGDDGVDVAAIESGIDQLASQMSMMGIRETGVSSLAPSQVLQLLQAAAPRSLPTYGDSIWQPLPLRPRPPTVPPPASYPAQRLPIFDNPALFEKLDPETLFFSFYQQPGTHQQYLAAKRLKVQSWRYHKQHCAWFQRQEDPKATGDDWEKGNYIYFDSQLRAPEAGAAAGAASAGWCYRLKSDFVFEYKALEDELVG